MKYEQISTKTNPELTGWYNTDKGELYWFRQETVWSCRDDRVSEEYPHVWYLPISSEHYDNGKDEDVKKELFEVETCECGHEVPIEFSQFDGDCSTCVNCVNDELIFRLSKKNKQIKSLKNKLAKFSQSQRKGVSDEEIEQWAEYCADNSVGEFDTKVIIKAALMLGAQWHRSKLTNNK